MTAIVQAPAKSATAPATGQARWRSEAGSLAARLPSLVIAARQLAQSVMYGVHGRRRAGPGENFWQFRPFISGEPAMAIDWRRSAREDRSYVREREWEAAHTVWLWIDRSASMRFASPMAQASKIERAVVLGLAAADLLVRGGERVGLLGLTRPLATRGVIERFAEAIAVDVGLNAAPAALPDAPPLKAHSKAILIVDFLSEDEEIRRRIAALAAQGAECHLVMIADPIEEAFPYQGHTEFVGADGGLRLRAPRRARPERRIPDAAAASSRRGARGLRRTGLELRHPPHRSSRGRSAARLADAARSADLLSFTPRRLILFGLPLAFTAPAALAALALLAALYIFLRITPPRPRQTVFPPLRLLLGINPKDQTPARTPWPLLLLRLAVATAAILAMAGPIWNPSLFGGGAGPLLMIVDDGWPAAPSWEQRKALIGARLDAAARDTRLVALLPVSQGGVDVAPAEAARNSERLHALGAAALRAGPDSGHRADRQVPGAIPARRNRLAR